MSYLHYRLNYEFLFNLYTYTQIFQSSIISVNNSHFTFQCFTVNDQNLTTTTTSTTTTTTATSTTMTTTTTSKPEQSTTTKGTLFLKRLFLCKIFTARKNVLHYFQVHRHVPQWRVSYSLLWCLFYSFIKRFHKRLLFAFHCLKLNKIKIDKSIWKCLLQRCILE
jgi:hypothetical protein